MRFKLNRGRATHSEHARAREAVMQVCRIARIETHSPTDTYVANREMAYSDIKYSQQMIEDHVRR